MFRRQLPIIDPSFRLRSRLPQLFTLYYEEIVVDSAAVGTCPFHFDLGRPVSFDVHACGWVLVVGLIA